jgi:hypothetical protein
MHNIKAIETHYKGYRFRSRLEARWAVFFDAFKELHWTYEPEGFDLDGLWYLPDFLVWVDGVDIKNYIEVKPRHETESKKADALAEALAERSDNEFVYVVSGDPIDWFGNNTIPCPRCFGAVSAPTADIPGLELYIDCWPCDVNTPSGGDELEEYGFAGARVTPYKGCLKLEPKSFARYIKSINRAATRARGSRFEFGENA